MRGWGHDLSKKHCIGALKAERQALDLSRVHEFQVMKSLMQNMEEEVQLCLWEVHTLSFGI